MNKIFTTTILSFILFQFVICQNDPKWDDTKSKNWPEKCEVVRIISSLDTTEQPAYFYAAKNKKPRPLIISLHTWSGGYDQKDSLSWICIDKDFNYIHPHFRGPNWTIQACGSKFAIQDIEDAITYAIENANVDTTEIHVIGTSGGGYATLLTYMSSHHNIKTFSAWVPISNVADWYYESVGRRQKYAKDIAKATTGKQFEDEDIYLDKNEAKKRSPIFMTVPVERRKESQLFIYAGLHDGYLGSVPITQSLKFYNKAVSDYDSLETDALVTTEEMLMLVERRNTNFDDLSKLKIGDTIFTRQYKNLVKITIFEGAHQMLVNRAISHIYGK